MYFVCAYLLCACLCLCWCLFPFYVIQLCWPARYLEPNNCPVVIRYYIKINIIYLFFFLLDGPSPILLSSSFLFPVFSCVFVCICECMFAGLCVIPLSFPPIRLFLSTIRSSKNPWHINRMGNHQIDTFTLLSYILSSNLTNLCSIFILVPLLLSDIVARQHCVETIENVRPPLLLLPSLTLASPSIDSVRYYI